MNFYLVLFFIGLSLGIIGQLLLKKGMIHIGEVNLFSGGLSKFVKTVWMMFTNKIILLGVFLFACSSLFWLIVLSGLDLSYVYPMISLSYVLTAIGSKIFFQEHVNRMRWLSIAVIIFGVILVSSS